MGADFKEKTRPTFEKCWDKAAVEANTPNLFSKASDHAPSRYEAEALGGSVLQVGESVCVRVESGRVVGRRGLPPVLTISAPPASLIKSIGEGCNIALADIVAADPISGVFEVTIN